jgi:WD40 repeat protein/transcriptional regulator with XRE-family HTH domain
LIMASPVQSDVVASFSTFGDFLKFLRRRAGLTQLELSIAVGYSEAQISRLEQNQRLPDLAALKALFIPALHLEREPELITHLLALAESARQEDAPLPGIAPYKGLPFFDEADADLFFGREALTARLVERVNALARALPRLLAIVGASGSGKSSVVRAGLAVALKRAGWDVCVFTPTLQPLQVWAAIGNGLQLNIPRDTSTITRRCLIIVDQFEEIFTLCRDEGARAEFVERVLDAANEPNGRITIGLALRADFYSRCAQYPPLRQAIAQYQEYIGEMTREELQRAIEEPAKRGGWEFEPGLVDLMLSDVGAGGAQDQEPGALPLLSHALLATWERRRGRMFTLAGYRASGGVRRAIAETAESVFTDQLNQQQQRLARDIFLRLTELGEGTEDTRRRAGLTELVPRADEAAQLRAVLNTLADARLVMLGEDSAEVAHEALIREWTRLRDWLNENREGLRLHRRLTEAAQAWQKLNREPGELYRSARLAQALEWAKTNVGKLNPLEREFLDASKEMREREEAEREAQRQRELVAAHKLAEAERRRATVLRWVAIGSSILLVVMIGLVVFAFSQRDTAENERRIAFARELSVNALSNLDVDSERSILLALQAISVSSAGGKPVLREAEEALHRAVMTSRVRMTLRGHAGNVPAATFSPDGKRIATASQDKTAKIWDAATGKELLTLTGHTERVPDVAFSPDGKRLATVSWDKSAKVWDSETGKELMTIQVSEESLTVAFSPDGTQIATGCGNRTAKVWDISTALNTGAATGKLLFTLPCQAPGNNSIAYSPDGKRIAVRDVEMTAKVYDAETGKEVLVLGKPEVPTMNIYIAYSPDGKRIATATYEGQVNVWDAISGRALLSWTAQLATQAVAFDRPFGTRLFTSHTDGTIKGWDISSASIQGAGSMTVPLLFTLAGHVSGIWGLEVSPDGSQLVTSSFDYTARIWDITDSGTSEWLTISDGACCYAFYSPDGKRLIGTSRINTSLYGVNKVNIWDATTGQVLRTIDTGQICSLNLSRDGKRFMAVTCARDLSHMAKVGDNMSQFWDNMAQVWDVDTGNQLFSVPNPNADDTNMVQYGAAFHPDGTRAATATGKGNITIWDINSGKEVMTLSGHTSNVNALAYSPDGTRLASNAETVKIWDALTGKELRTLPARGYSVSFSPDGTRLATASDNGTATVWDVATGKALQTLRGHAGSIFSVAFSPDGNRLVTGSADSTIKVWDVSPGAKEDEQPLTLYGVGTTAMTAQFSPDGKRLAASWSYRGAPASVRVFALDLDDIRAIAKSRVTRALTNDECRKYLHVEQCPSQP